MDSAIRLSKGIKGGLRIVTRGGEIINSSGAITGGRYKNKSANLLSRRGEIAKLENEIRLLSEDTKLNEQSLQNLKVFLSNRRIHCFDNNYSPQKVAKNFIIFVVI